MKRLVAFGDSYTYGDGLADCWVKHSSDNYTSGNVCSQYAWPALVAKNLGYSVVNSSCSGLSNLGMLHRLLNTVFTENDVCVIMWSFPHRDMIFNKNYMPHIANFNTNRDYTNRTTHVGSWMDDDLTKYWMLTHNNTDLLIRSWLHIHHANLYLDSLNIPHYNFFINYGQLKSHKPSYIKIPFADILVERYIDRALDGDHPGPLSQERMAKEITLLIDHL